MVNTNNRIEGRGISRHPLADVENPRQYSKVGTVFAVEAPIGGVISTPEGEMRFQAGDFIVTDNPVTHAWPVQAQVFRNTYHLIGEIASPGVVPTEVKRAAIKRKPRARAAKVPRRQTGPRTSFPGKRKGPGEPGRDMAAIADSVSTEALGG